MARKINIDNDMLEKGVEVLKYWNPNDDQKRQQVKDECKRIEKKIYNTIKKYLLLWCIIIIATIVICIKFI